MRYVVPVLFVLLLAACTGSAGNDVPVPVPENEPSAAGDTIAGIKLVPLSHTGLRFNGVYHTSVGSIQYYMRFFERGNVALVVGPETANDTIRIASYLTENVQSGWNNVHNVPVTLRNDSLLFRTMALNGAITYAGVVDGDSVRFLKASEVNGKRAIVAYGFEPDQGSK